MTPAVSHSLQYIHQQNPQLTGDIYEFGVYIGTSLGVTMQLIASLSLSVNHVYGFDSFVGLPQESTDLEKRGPYLPGEFDLRSILHTDDVDAIMAYIYQQLKPIATVPVTLIPGFYEKSLCRELIEAHNMQPAMLVHVDCDMYISAYQALDFLFGNNLIQNGTIISYNDWGGTLEHSQEYETGESRAHMEIMNKYRARDTQIFQAGYTPPHIEKVFKIQVTS